MLWLLGNFGRDSKEIGMTMMCWMRVRYWTLEAQNEINVSLHILCEASECQ